MTVANAVGKLCSKNLHEIRSENDLVKIHRNSGKVERGCKVCRRENERRRRASEDHTLLGRGRCRYDHPLRTQADVVVVRHQLGRPIHACRACKEDPKKSIRAITEDKPRPLRLSCGCEPHFRAPIPKIGDFILCSLHNTGTEVLRWV